MLSLSSHDFTWMEQRKNHSDSLAQKCCVGCWKKASRASFMARRIIVLVDNQLIRRIVWVDMLLQNVNMTSSIVVIAVASPCRGDLVERCGCGLAAARGIALRAAGRKSRVGVQRATGECRQGRLADIDTACRRDVAAVIACRRSCCLLCALSCCVYVSCGCYDVVASCQGAGWARGSAARWSHWAHGGCRCTAPSTLHASALTPPPPPQLITRQRATRSRHVTLSPLTTALELNSESQTVNSCFPNSSRLDGKSVAVAFSSSKQQQRQRTPNVLSWQVFNDAFWS